METLKECGVCLQVYNTAERTPRVLLCGHSLCSECLTQIIKSRKCPFDSLPFLDSQDSLASFPFNFAVKGYLEQMESSICESHQKPLKWMCFTDRRKICSECAKQEHRDHRIKKIKELKADAEKIKKDLEEISLETQRFEENAEKDIEEIKNTFFSTISEEFKKIRNILVKKEIEVVQQAKNFLNAEKSSPPSESLFTLRQQIKETINDINYGCQDDKNLMLLDKESNRDEIIEKSRLIISQSTQIYHKVLGMQRLYQESLDLSKATISSLQIPIKEIDLAPLSEEEIEKLHKPLMGIRFQSYFDIEMTKESLEISTGGDELKSLEIYLDDFQTAKTIGIHLKRYDTLKSEPSPSLLSYVLSGLEQWTSLDLFFDPDGFNNDPMLYVGNVISGHVEHLKSLFIDLQICKMTYQPMRTLCDLVFSRIINLQEFYINFSSSHFTNSDVDIFVKAIKSFAKNLECFRISLNDNKLTPDSFNKLFQAVQDMEKLEDLTLILSQTNLLDESLGRFGNDVLPHLKALESLSLHLSKCDLSDTGILSVIQKLPNLKRLDLDLSQTLVTEKTSQELLQFVLPRLKSSLKSFTFSAVGTEISKFDLERIQNFSEKLKEKKTADFSGFFLAQLILD